MSGQIKICHRLYLTRKSDCLKTLKSWKKMNFSFDLKAVRAFLTEREPSYVTPKYLAVFRIGNPNKVLLVWGTPDSTMSDLSWLMTRSLSSQNFFRNSVNFSSSQTSGVMIMISSAYPKTVLLFNTLAWCNRSFRKRLKSIGERREPWGRPFTSLTSNPSNQVVEFVAKNLHNWIYLGLQNAAFWISPWSR